MKAGTWIAIGLIGFLIGAAIGGWLKPKAEIQTTGLTIIDAAGREITLAKTPKRVVSLIQYITGLLAGIGAENTLVGVNKTGAFPSDYPFCENLPDVGNAAQINVEKVLALNPDVVFTWVYFYPQAKVLEEKGLTVIALAAKDFDTLVYTIRLLGRIMGKVKEAENVASNIENRVKKLKEKTKAIPENKRPLVYYESHTGRTGSAGTTWHEIITLAGGINIYAESPIEYPIPNYEYILARNPDVIVKAYDPKLTSAENVKNEIINRPGWREIKAVKNDRIFIYDWRLSRWDTKTIDFVENFAKWLHPELFP